MNHLTTKRPKTVTIKLQWYAVLRKFSPDIRLEVYEAVFDYIAFGDVRPLSQAAEMAFEFIRFEIDQAAERRRIAAARRAEKAAAETTAVDNAEPTATETNAPQPEPQTQQTETPIPTRLPRKLKKKLKKEQLQLHNQVTSAKSAAECRRRADGCRLSALHSLRRDASPLSQEP